MAYFFFLFLCFKTESFYRVEESINEKKFVKKHAATSETEKCADLFLYSMMKTLDKGGQWGSTMCRKGVNVRVSITD